MKLYDVTIRHRPGHFTLWLGVTWERVLSILEEWRR